MAEECWEIVAPKHEGYEKIYFATGNDGKIERANIALSPLDDTIKIEKYPDIVDVEETGKTPLECALQKLEAYK